MLVFSDEELANNVKGSPLLVSFVKGEMMKDYGVRLVEYLQLAKFQ